MSRKPRVVSNAVRAPLRSMIAFVKSVVPWTNNESSPAEAPASASASTRTRSTASAGESFVESVFAIATTPSPSARHRSVNVPPMSTPTRLLIPQAYKRGFGLQRAPPADGISGSQRLRSPRPRPPAKGQESTVSNDQSYDVAILGGGLAGLTLAHQIVALVIAHGALL